LNRVPGNLVKNLILCSFFFIVCVFSQTLIAQTTLKNTRRILFLGNSITYSGGYVNDVEAYLLAHSPNKQDEIINVGLPSETVSGLSEPGHADGRFPRPDLHERLDRILKEVKPDVVFACYGMNDGIYQPFDLGRFAKFKEGIEWLHDKIVNSGARLIHITPPVYDDKIDPAVKYEAVLQKYSDWLLGLRASRKWEVIDIHYPMLNYLEAHQKIDTQYKLNGFALAPDGVHPGETGHWIMARQILFYLGFKEVMKVPGINEDLARIHNGNEIFALVKRRQVIMRDAWLSLTKHQRPGLPDGMPMKRAADSSAKISLELDELMRKDSIIESKWFGFRRIDLKFAGRNCLIVFPSNPARDNPWIWRTEFFGHEPQGDSTLASRGFHVAYIDLQDMYGSAASLDLMDKFYALLTDRYHLNKRVVLEGFSRGGLFAFNWAAKVPAKVSCIYVDAPVCDFKSWPGGKGKSPGSKADWEKLKKAYGFKSDDEALAYKFNPIDNLAPIANAGIPVIAVCGETDDLVPMAENISIVEKKYLDMGGKIKVISKPNNGHHPHSLKDPTVIVDYILTNSVR